MHLLRFSPKSKDQVKEGKSFLSQKFGSTRLFVSPEWKASELETSFVTFTPMKNSNFSHIPRSSFNSQALDSLNS